MLVRQLYETLRKLIDTLRSAGLSDVSRFYGSIEKVKDLDSAFIITKPFLTGLRRIRDIIDNMKASEISSIIQGLNELEKEVEHLVSSTKRVSLVMRAILILISLLIMMFSFSVYALAPQTMYLTLIPFTIVIFITATFSLFAALIYSSISIVLTPLTLSLAFIESLILYMNTRSLTLLVLTVITALGFVFALRFTIGTLTGFRKILMMLMEIETRVNGLSESLKVTTPTEIVIMQERIREKMKNLEQEFRKVYGSRAEEIMKYIEEMSRLRELMTHEVKEEKKIRRESE